MSQYRTVIDQMGRVVKVPTFPRRIISLVPSQTELLFHLGLEEEVVGITKFCVHPADKFKEKPRVGGTKRLKPSLIDKLQPDLIIGNKEENEQTQIEALAEQYPVWLSDVRTLEDAFDMIRKIGDLIQKEASAEKLVKKLQSDFDHLSKVKHRPRVAYFIWRKPWMAVAGNTFIDHMLQQAGFENVFGSLLRYPEIDRSQLEAAQPEVLLLSSEPYPFKPKHFAEFGEVCPRAVITLVDGELFSWYGSRLLQSASYFRNLHSQIENELNDGLEK